MSKIKLGIIYGGKSTEHEVSIRSASSVFDALRKDKYELELIYITKDGQWLLANDKKEVKIIDQTKGREILVSPASGLTVDNKVLEIDAVLPILHGTAGEDGTIQGLLELANIPFAGCSVRSSAVCMDKDMTKRLLQENGIETAAGIMVNYFEQDQVNYKDVETKLGLPMFIKPVNQGSSVGVSKVTNESEFYQALELAFNFDSKVMIEKGIDGREIEVSVLGDEELFVSVPGEIVSNTEFYSYDSKYLDDDGAVLNIPANLDDEVQKRIQDIAKKTFRTLDCEGMARVDVFLEQSGKIIVNEVNTLPGFTSISMYPKLLEVSGIPYADLLDQLVTLALKRKERENRLKTDLL
ncbi:D-alanine--D-alanine ligase family protein [Jeotgalicoccus meleagridis]|uniref:D-alanine--D-alanine ligase n=1 Tax=Jeotgalicoccus meleagridis TaxID=2759181 RepID=A0A6V7REH6_9STAP|nr:D-alanine--D-alanine ligase family protein [Jeotgalicoccus meleagridis]CAD2075552.1 D-alanine--D-alanine ligase A [Jeotgalicoccus meleagridis]